MSGYRRELKGARCLAGTFATAPLMKDQSVICAVSPGYASAPTAPLIGLYPIYNHQRQRRGHRNGCEREQKGRLGKCKRMKEDTENAEALDEFQLKMKNKEIVVDTVMPLFHFHFNL